MSHPGKTSSGLCTWAEAAMAGRNLGGADLGPLPAGLGCNIVQSDQFTNVEPAGASTYFQRIEFDFSRIHIGAGNTEASACSIVCI